MITKHMLQDAGRTDGFTGVERLLRVRLTGRRRAPVARPASLFFFTIVAVRSVEASEKHSRPIMIHCDEFGSRAAPQAVLRLTKKHADDSLELV